MTSSPRGGSRPNAGRHSLYIQPLHKCTFGLPDHHIQTLLQIDPNLSASLRVILDDPKLSRAIRNFIDKRKERINVTNSPDHAG